MTYDESNGCAQPARNENPATPPTSGPARVAPVKGGLAGGHAVDGRPSGRTASTNAMTHGLRSDPALASTRLALGNLPPGHRRIERGLYAFRRWLVSAVVAKHGDVDAMAELAIHAACRYERAARLGQKWLTDHGATMPTSEKLAFSDAICKATERRDAAIARLQLDASGSPADWADAYYRGAQSPR